MKGVAHPMEGLELAHLGMRFSDANSRNGLQKVTARHDAHLQVAFLYQDYKCGGLLWHR